MDAPDAEVKVKEELESTADQSEEIEEADELWESLEPVTEEKSHTDKKSIKHKLEDKSSSKPKKRRSKRK